MSDKCLPDIEDVVRALFTPSMLDNNEMVSLSAEVLKPIPYGVSAIGLLMRIQTKLVQLANENIVKLQEPLAEDKQAEGLTKE